MFSRAEDIDTGTLKLAPAKPGEPRATEVKAVQMQNRSNPKDPKKTYDGKPVPQSTKVPETPPLPKDRRAR